jgi:serine/threonine protein kinase
MAPRMPIHRGEHFVEKRLSSRERNEPEARARLRSEALLLERLAESGKTPRLLAHGEDENGPWHRIERVRLPTLDERLEVAAGKPLDGAWISRAARASFVALAALHEAADASGPLELVHADLSPANLAIDDDGGHVVVLDFDLAWWRDGPSRGDGAFRGTIGYTAPEIARGEAPTVQSDLFSLAAIFLHAITGAPPRSGPSFAAVLALAAEAPLLGPVHDGLAARGPAHAAVVACLAHERDRRPASANAVLSGWPMPERGPGRR